MIWSFSVAGARGKMIESNVDQGMPYPPAHHVAIPFKRPMAWMKRAHCENGANEGLLGRIPVSEFSSFPFSLKLKVITC